MHAHFDVFAQVLASAVGVEQVVDALIVNLEKRTGANVLETQAGLRGLEFGFGLWRGVEVCDWRGSRGKKVMLEAQLLEYLLVWPGDMAYWADKIL